MEKHRKISVSVKAFNRLLALKSKKMMKEKSNVSMADVVDELLDEGK